MQKFTCTGCSYIYNPFLWEEDILPGTAFEDLPESWLCPHCGEEKESFIENPIYIQELSRKEAMTEQELSHIPFYREEWDVILVKIGTDDAPHETGESHFIEYVGLFDSEGEAVELRLSPEENSIVFENPELDEYEIRLSCSMHGVWRGVKVQ